MSLFKEHYHWHTMRNFVIAFGNLFSDLTIVKYDDNGNKRQSYEVPVEFAPKNKWISRLREQPDLMSNQVQTTLPRVAFEFVDLRYAPDRKIGTNGTFVTGIIGDKKTKIMNPVPYDVVMTLTTATKDNNDSFQLLEQIIPFFQPYATINFEILPQFNIHKDVPITMSSYQNADTYEGGTDELRLVTQTFTFTAQLDFFGPIFASSSVIKDAIVNMYQDPTMVHPYNKLEAKVNPTTANKTDPHTIIETNVTI